MYIKNSKGTMIINSDHFDGIQTETYIDNTIRLNLFKAEHEPTYSKLAKSVFCIGTYGHQQALAVLGEIEQALVNGEKLYVLPEPEVRNA